MSTAASIVPQKQSISELIQEEKDRTVMVMSSTASVAPAKTSFSPMSFLLGRSHSRDKREELLAPAEPAIQRAITPASVLYDDELNQFTSYYDQTAHTRSNTLIYQSGPQRVKVDHSAETAQNQAANQTIPVQRSIANVPTRQQQRLKMWCPLLDTFRFIHRQLVTSLIRHYHNRRQTLLPEDTSKPKEMQLINVKLF